MSEKGPVAGVTLYKRETTSGSKPVKRARVNGKAADSIFACSASRSDVALDVMKADCMNHGYHVTKSLGEGAYAKVKLADVLPNKLAKNKTLADIAENTGTLNVAVKVIDNSAVPREFLEKFLPRELKNHVPLPPHPNVVRVYEQFATTERVYVVMEYCSRGDLLDLVNKRISDSFRGLGEDVSRKLFHQVCLGVNHIHSNDIAHRDLKCENILLNHNGDLKITDFGFSCKFNEKSKLLKTSCGSYAYTAPEVIKSKLYDGFRSDTWSLGVILFAMLNGRLPFNDAQLVEMEEDMKMQRLRFERSVSFESMVLVRRILQYDPSNRPSVADILNDSWITGKRPIPRQMAKPKWINPYHDRNEPCKHARKSGSRQSQGTYFKATIPERVQEVTTVTINYGNMETVKLKSRGRGYKKNIWSTGPSQANRPNTWPLAAQNSPKDPRKRILREYHGPKSRIPTTTAETPPIKSGPVNTSSQSTTGGSKVATSLRLSKWFMDQYKRSSSMLEKRDSDDPDIEAACKNPPDAIAMLSTYKEHSEESLRELAPSVSGKGLAEDKCAKDTEAERSKSCDPARTQIDVTVTRGAQTAREPGKCGPKRSCSRVSQGFARRPVRKTAPKSARIKDSKPECAFPVTSRSADLGAGAYQANRSPSPVGRMKFFRDRFERLYKGTKSKYKQDCAPLPPLSIQSLSAKLGEERPAGQSRSSDKFLSGVQKGAVKAKVNSFRSRKCNMPSRLTAQPARKVINHP